MALYRPIEINVNGSIIHDDNINDFCDDLKTFYNAIDKMRIHTNLALAIFNYHLKFLQLIHDNFVEKSISESKLCILEKDPEHPYPKSGILFNNMTNEQMLAIISNLTIDDLAKLGVQIGAFKNTKYTYLSHMPKTLGDYDFQGFVTVLELTDEISIEYKKKPKYSYYGCRIWSPGMQTQADEDYILTHYPNRSLPLIDIDNNGLSSDRGLIILFQDILVQVIVNRQKQMSQQWSDYLNDKSDEGLYRHVENLYRAKFILELLIYGGYGKTFQYAVECKELSEIIDKLNDVWSFIEYKWMKGQDGIIDFPSITSINSGSITTFALTETEQFLSNYGKFLPTKYIDMYYDFDHPEPEPEVTPENLISYVKSITIPNLVNSPFIKDIGNLEKAEALLLFASNFDDIKPSKSCFNK